MRLLGKRMNHALFASSEDLEAKIQGINEELARGVTASVRARLATEKRSAAKRLSTRKPFGERATERGDDPGANPVAPSGIGALCARIRDRLDRARDERDDVEVEGVLDWLASEIERREDELNQEGRDAPSPKREAALQLELIALQEIV